MGKRTPFGGSTVGECSILHAVNYLVFVRAKSGGCRTIYFLKSNCAKRLTFGFDY